MTYNSLLNMLGGAILLYVVISVYLAILIENHIEDKYDQPLRGLALLIPKVVGFLWPLMLKDVFVEWSETKQEDEV